MMRSGLGSLPEITAWIVSGEVSVDGVPGYVDQVLEPGMTIGLRDGEYLVAALENRPRFLLKPVVNECLGGNCEPASALTTVTSRKHDQHLFPGSLWATNANAP